MPKVLIIYDSKTGNTQKMSEAVAEGVKSVKGVEVEMYKVGTPFSISLLDEADAIVLGSPSIYGTVTQEMRAFINSAIELKKANRLKITGKVGGVFGSYAWDGGWVVDKLAEALRALDIELVHPPVSAVDRRGSMGERIDEESLQKCKELGKAIAEKLIKA